MAEEIGFENGRNSNFQGLVTLTLILDPAIRHTVVHHLSTSTYIPNFIESKKLFVDGRTYGRTDRWTYGRTFSPSNIIRSTFGSRPKKYCWFNSLVFCYVWHARVQMTVCLVCLLFSWCILCLT